MNADPRMTRRRKAARAARPVLPCGIDPDFPSRPRREPGPDEVQAAALHLLQAVGTPGTGYPVEHVRTLWRRGGADSRLAERIYQHGGIHA